MSKGQQKETYGTARQQIGANNANETSANQQLQGIAGSDQANINSLSPAITGGYSGLSGTGGGFDPTAMGTINNTYTNLANGTGPGSSTYSNLALTGGFTPSDITSMENKASQAAQSTYATGAAQAQRQQAATGGYGVSGDLINSLAREGSQAGSAAITGVDANIASMKQAGQIAGASGLQSGAIAGAGGLTSSQQAQTGNQLAALGGESNVLGMNMQQLSQTVGQILQNYQQTGQMNAQDMAIMTNLANQPGTFDKIMSTLKTLGGVAAGIGVHV